MNQGKLSKEILNYFAAFTETRFNFRRLINYRWTNSELTLDLSFYTGFQNQLLQKVSTGSSEPVTIKGGEYTLKLSGKVVKDDLIATINNSFTADYLQTCINEFHESAPKVMHINDKGETVMFEGDLTTKEEIQTEEGEWWSAATRKYNIALRKELETILIQRQTEFIEEKKQEFGITHVPQTVFGQNNYLQEHYSQWQKIATKTHSTADYVQAISSYIEKEFADIVLYDLFFNLQKYETFSNMGTTYAFFHSIGDENASYPLYFLELEFRLTQSEVLVTFPRNLLLLNTPAINGYKFDQVLTTPRSSSLSRAKDYLGAIEVYLQTQYGKHTPFIHEPNFKDILHDEEGKPKIEARIGLQTITNEDKKLLDYSEIMTRLDEGETSSFTNLVSSYIQGQIPNFTQEVSEGFQQKYPAKSPERYLSSSPIPISDSQKRILLALQNEKNRVVVVDGPPGTGKSHTIAALTYWANENKKSVVITSHKQEALDVIDRMLSTKYESLHPQAKPSIVRMDSNTGSPNGLQNTLQNAVINAANDRALEYNQSAIESDTKRIDTELRSILEDKINASTEDVDSIKQIVEFHNLHSELTQSEIAQQLPTLRKEPQLGISVQTITRMLDSDIGVKLAGVSLDEFKWVTQKQEQLADFLDACEKINGVTPDSLSFNTTLREIPDDYRTLLEELTGTFKTNIPLAQLTVNDGVGGVFSGLLGKNPSKEQKETLLHKLQSLQHNTVVAEIARAIESNKQDITLEELNLATNKVAFKISFRSYEAWVNEYKRLPNNEQKGIPELYESVQRHQSNQELFTKENQTALEVLFAAAPQLLEALEVTAADLSSLKLVNDSELCKQVWRYLEVFGALAMKSNQKTPHTPLLNEYYKLEQKRVEHINDNRLKNLNNHVNEIQRIKTSFEGNKRFSREEADVLLNNISCIIAEPKTISKHFPMDEDMIDVLIIDEASQVSIADSISLILRAKQVVVLGDEYQYGAVSAVNVNAKYSTSYFSQIINAYADEFHTNISKESVDELMAGISEEVTEDNQMSDDVITSTEIQPGTVLWLKTFNIRTSTLSFAKAMANYSTSLKEHFRSFPEIIGYSNETFYKPAQMELVVNRIRTQPIAQTLVFMPVDTKGEMAQNTNLDEIEAIIQDIETRVTGGYTGTIGIITSFREQQQRLVEAIRERLDLPRLERDHKLSVWFVGDVQGEERDLIYYSFVEDKKISNANLGSIYPVIGGTADNIRSLKMQRLNVGFSRAKDIMVFVHSQDLEDYSNTRLGDALKFYKRTLDESAKNDMFIADTTVFGSPKEEELYQRLMATDFIQSNQDAVTIVPQFPIGKYLRAEYAAQLPDYRVDFLVTYNKNGTTDSLILEYDGLEWHFKDPTSVSANAVSSEFTDYDVQRQLELESYGYRFLRINCFTLLPESPEETEVDVLNRLLNQAFA